MEEELKQIDKNIFIDLELGKPDREEPLIKEEEKESELINPYARYAPIRIDAEKLAFVNSNMGGNPL
jgi:hypothetical protein